MSAGKNIGADLDRDWPLRVLPHRDARHAQASGFFLNSARIGYYKGGVLHQTDKIQVSQRADYHNAVLWPRMDLQGIEVAAKSILVNRLLGPGMSRKDNGRGRTEFLEAFEDLSESCRIVHVCWTMQSQQSVRLDLRSAIPDFARD